MGQHYIPNINKAELLELWDKVQNKDKTAKWKLLKMHNLTFPHATGSFNKNQMSYDNMHTMFLQIDSVIK